MPARVAPCIASVLVLARSKPVLEIPIRKFLRIIDVKVDVENLEVRPKCLERELRNGLLGVACQLVVKPNQWHGHSPKRLLTSGALVATCRSGSALIAAIWSFVRGQV